MRRPLNKYLPASFFKRFLHVLFALSILIGGVEVYGQVLAETQRLFGEPPVANTQLGQVVDISGEYAVAGVRLEETDVDDENPLDRAGAVFVYRKNASNGWDEVQKLVASDRAARQEFGFSVAIEGDVIVVGSGRRNSTVYFFQRNPSGIWEEVSKFIRDDVTGGSGNFAEADGLGSAVAISGDYAIVGASYDDYDTGFGGVWTGAAYAFERAPDGTWSVVQRIVASERSPDGFFGYRISMDGEYAIISGTNYLGPDNFSPDGIPLVYVFERNAAGEWLEVQQLVQSNRVEFDGFGSPSAISGTTIAVSAPFAGESPGGIEGSGTVFLFDLVGGVWEETQQLNASDWSYAMEFGLSLSLKNEVLLVGANKAAAPATSAGALYTFRLTEAGSWEEVQKVVASDQETGDMFGNGLAFDGADAIVGAIGKDVLNEAGTLENGAGAVYFFELIDASFTAPEDLCLTAGIQMGLSGGTPTGGVYAGDGVMDDGNGLTYSFDPAAAGPGTHTISYEFTGGNGYSESDSDEVFVDVECDDSPITGMEPDNNICDLAIPLPSFPRLQACPDDDGVVFTSMITGTNVGADPTTPFPNSPACANGASPDVYYQFQASGAINDVVVTTNDMNGLQIFGFVGDDCQNLQFRACGEGSSLAEMRVIAQPGQQVYLMVAGAAGDLMDEGTFTIEVESSSSCSACALEDNGEVTISPQNGSAAYACGATAEICFTLYEWQGNDAGAEEWIHSVVPTLGDGWDLTTITPTLLPISCSGNGTWEWYPNGWTGCFTGIVFERGFAYETNSGSDNSCGPSSSTPGNNFGDGGSICTNIPAPLTWCFTVQVNDCSTVTNTVNGQDLSVSFQVAGDAYSGSWNRQACDIIPSYETFASVIVCDEPLLVSLSELPDVGLDAGIQTGLSGGLPTGGVYSGPGVTDDGNGMTFSFDPTASPMGGNITVSYTFTGENGCSATAEENMFVDPVCNRLPMAICQPVMLDADENCVAFVAPEAFDGGSTDLDMDELTFSIDPGGPFPIGTTDITLTVSDGEDMSQCTTTVTVLDRVLPTIFTSPDDVELLCVDFNDDNILTTLDASVSKCYRVTPATGAIIPGSMDVNLSNRLLAGGDTPLLPTFTNDFTTEIEVCVDDVLVFDEVDPSCSDVVLTRTFTATGQDGCVGEESVSVTTSYEITFARNLTINDLDTENFLEIAIYNECGVQNPTRADYPAPRLGDFPSLLLGDRTITLRHGEAVCNVGVTFSDGEAIVDCPNSYRFVRFYTVIDWCDPSEVRSLTQIVKVGDTTAPTFSGPTQDRDFDGVADVDLVYTTDQDNFCAAFIRLDEGISAEDNCSSLVSAGGGITITASIYPDADLNATPIGPFVVNITDDNADMSSAIPLGCHLLRYNYTDECENSGFSDYPFCVEGATTSITICESIEPLSISPELSLFCSEDTPLSGVFTGPGVTDNEDGRSFTFDPAAEGVVVGNNTLSYSILEQLGEDIYGEASDDQIGRAISLSADGSRLAIGSGANEGGGSLAGHVRIFEYNGTNWEQLGFDIDGEAQGDQSGTSVSLSADGSRVAIGAPRNDGSGTDAGHVRIYEYNDTNWEQLGADIDGAAEINQSGRAVALSADGSRVAIGARLNNGAGDRAGHVRLFEYNGTNWIKLGEDIEGEASLDFFGNVVSMSNNGNRIAIGAPYNDGAATNAGHVRIYDYDGCSWVQVGDDIDGETEGDVSGRVSLSADGNRVAIGALENDDAGTDAGHVRIYDFNGSSWVQVGDDIDGETEGDFSGRVSLSADGNLVAIGAPGHNSIGHVRLYQFNDNSWVQLGPDIDGDIPSGAFGFSVSLSSSGGYRLAVGIPFVNNFDMPSSGLGVLVGLVRVYNFQSVSTQLEVLPAPTAAFTAPTPDICIEDATQSALSGGAPSGGVYSGPGVIDDENGMTFSFDPTASPMGGNITVSYTFTGENGCSTTAEDDIFVDPVCNRSPIALCQPVMQDADENCEAIVAAEGFDGGSTDPDMDELTFSIDLAGPFPIGTTDITLTVSDGEEMSQCTTTVMVIDNTPPVVEANDTTLYLDENGLAELALEDFSYTLNDNCGATLTDIFRFDNHAGANNDLGADAGASNVEEAKSLDQLLSFDCDDVGNLNLCVEIIAQDEAGNETRDTITVTVLDTLKPIVVCQDLDVYLDANGVWSYAEEELFTATDNCAVDFTPYEQAIPLSCEDLGSIEVPLTVADLNGNDTSCVVTVTVLDTLKPTVVCQDIEVILDENGEGTYTELELFTATDNCAVDFTPFDQAFVLSCDDAGVIEVPLTIADVNGNDTMCVATVTVLDDTPPVITCEDVTVFLDENGNTTLTEQEILEAAITSTEENCGSTLVISNSLLIPTCDNVGDNPENIQVEDASGNPSNDCLFSIIVRDTFPAVVTVTDQILTLTDQDPTMTLTTADLVTATDNCGEAISEFDRSLTFTGADIGVNVLTVTVTDANGNVTTTTVTVIIDFEQPNVACVTGINLTLDDNCQGLLIPRMLLTGNTSLLDFFEFEIVVLDDDPSNGPVVDGCGRFQYSIAAVGEGDLALDFETCWGYVNAEDKTPPAVVTTPDDVDLLCVDLDANILTTLGASVSKCYRVNASNGATIPGTMASALRARLLAGGTAPLVPTFTDGCTEEIEVCVNDVVVYDEEDPNCEDVVLTRTFTATEIATCPSAAGEENPSVTASYTITFSRPDLDDLSADNIEPVVSYEQCGSANPSVADYPTPRAEDFPFLQVGDRSLNLTNGQAVCNIGVTFSDGPAIVTCPYTYKFIRT
ncbi:hypothetical protein [Neolewinella agarilytica]|uniref:hypothetical protein n=1 Tax=Neolewinella agarilytica TaxID=478744 RepID=UPI002357BF07|nr:hypothetical protein [Neolewinella agarilytica]